MCIRPRFRGEKFAVKSWPYRSPPRSPWWGWESGACWPGECAGGLRSSTERSDPRDGKAQAACSLRFCFATGRGRAGVRVSGGFASAEPALGLGLALLDLELAEEGLEADEQLVPVVLHVPQRVLVHLAEVADGRGGSDQ